MRNSKKLIAVIMTVAILASMMVPALAATYTTQADYLKAAGLMSGTGTSMNLEGKLDRMQGIVLALKIKGADAAITAMTDADVTAALANVVDADKIPAWGKKHAAYAVSTGMTKGVGGVVAPKIMFAPSAALNGMQFVIMTLQAMGYTQVTMANCWDLAQSAGVLTASQVVSFGIKGQLVRDDAAGIMFQAVKTGVLSLAGGITPGAVKLLTNLVEVAKTVTTTAGVAFGYAVPTPAPAAALTVSSITALNTKQIQVVFNKAMDKDTAETVGNYQIYDNGSATEMPIATAALSADKMSVLLTINETIDASNANDALTNATTAKVVVEKAVKDATGVALAADYTAASVAVADNKLPELLTVEATGSKTLKLTFSEPVWDGVDDDKQITVANITVKSGIYSFILNQASTVADYANNTIVVSLGAAMTNGSTVTVKVNANGLGAGSIVDFAGLNLLTKEVNFAYAPNLTPASVTLDSLNKSTGKAVVKFNKPVYGTSVNLYHSVKGVAQYGCTPLTKAEGVASDTWEFTFLNTVPSGTLTFYLESADVAADQLTDLFGIKVADASMSFTVTADTTVPTVSEVTVNENSSIDIKFSEDVKTAEAKAANFELKNAAGTVVTPTVGMKPASTDTIRLTIGLTDNETYTITVKAMQDVAGNAMAGTFTTTKTIGDNTRPSVSSFYRIDGNTFYIVFSEAMNATDLVNKSLYAVDGDSGSDFVTLDGDDTITVVDSKKVKIYFKDGLTANTADVSVTGLRDLAGKYLNGDAASTLVKTLSDVTLDTLTLDSVVATAKNKVKLTFSKPLATFDVTKFAVKKDADSSAPTTTDYGFISIESNTTNSSNKQEVVLVLANDLTTLAKNKVNGTEALEVLISAASGATSTDGTNLTTDDISITDSIAPEVAYVDYVSATKIIVFFTEPLKYQSLATAGKNGFTVAGGTLTSALLSPTTANSNAVILTGSEFTTDTDVVYTAGNVTDVVGNAFATVTKSDALTSATIVATANAPADNKVTLAFNNIAPTFIVAGNVDLLDAAGAPVAAVEIGTNTDITYVVSAPAGAGAGDQLNVAITAAGVLTVTGTDADNSMNGNSVTITITNTSTGVTETVAVALAVAGAAVTATCTVP